MAKSLQSVIDRHAQIVSEFQQRVADVRAERPVPNDIALRRKEQLLAGLDARVERERAARDATVAKLDERLATLQGRADALRSEIEADRELLDKRRGRPRRSVVGPLVGSVDRPARGPSTTGASGASLDTIRGVGKAYAERLRDAGLETPAQVAKAKPGELADMLGISEKRARTLVSEAKKVKSK